MGGGIAAFREKAGADAALRDWGGERLTLAQVLAEPGQHEPQSMAPRR
jgi:hypothetical protein